MRTTAFAEKRLVLLTQYPPTFPEGAERPDLVLRWYEVADAIATELVAPMIADPVCLFLCRQFHNFLKERNMALAQVSWQFSEGVRALRNFLVMLQEAARA